MSLKTKQLIIAFLGLAFVISLIFVQYLEVLRKQHEAGAIRHVAVPVSSKDCVSCHEQQTPGLIDHWKGSTHAEKGVGCIECHQANEGDADAFLHKGSLIATIVTPKDCGRCHDQETKEFMASHHAAAGKILHSLDNFLAETVEGNREPYEIFNPHAPSRAEDGAMVNGMASAYVGCHQCHGSVVSFESTDGGTISTVDLKPDPKTGKPTNKEALAKIVKDDNGKPVFFAGSWPNTGIGRLNLDGSRGSCSACHSRHDFSPRRARQPENCGKCHLGPDHPQKEIYEESKHGVAYRDLKEHMNLDAKDWVLGKDYTQAPTCATCHMSANTKEGVTHDPGQRISWTNRPPISRAMDTDDHGDSITETDPEKRAAMIVDTWQQKRNRMKLVCNHCHTPDYVNGFYKQYDDFVMNYNEKFAKPGDAVMKALLANKLRTKQNFDEKIEWTWFYLWHHEGRRARHGASMMAPDYAHWHGMYEVAERFYEEFIPQARGMVAEAKAAGNTEGAEKVEKLITDILARPEHKWYESQKKHGKIDAAAVEGAHATSAVTAATDSGDATDAEDTVEETNEEDGTTESTDPSPKTPETSTE